MLGLMMDWPLLISTVLEYAERFHGKTQIVTRSTDGSIHRYGYGDAALRCRQLAKALLELGVRPGQRIGTLAWTRFRHLELFYGMAGVGAVCHTINPRLAVDTLQDIVNRADDQYLFVDACFLPLVRSIADATPGVKAIIVLDPGAAIGAPALPGKPIYDYESLLAAENDSFDWPKFDERSAAALCYTRERAVHPKGFSIVIAPACWKRCHSRRRRQPTSVRAIASQR